MSDPVNDAAPVFGARLFELRDAIFDPVNLGQWAIIAVALAFGLLVRHLGRRASAGALTRNAFPDALGGLAALLTVVIGWRLAFHRHPEVLLRMAVPLLLAFTLVRLASHLMRTLLGGRLNVADDWERLIARTVWLVFALHVLGILDPLLDLLEEVTLPVGATQVSVLQIVKGGLILIAALLLSLWVGRVAERRVMGVETLDASLRVIFTKLLRGILLAVAVIFTLPLIGVDITFLSVLGGALGVGLGFGLQKIASNYVSGFIILLDRSVRLGDVITVDGRKGLVSHMEARYTVLKGSDGSETIVPNETFVTALVINHTLNDRAGTGGFSLWLAHDADIHAAIAAIVELLRARPDVLQEPAPAAQVNQVTDIGIELQVVWWVPDLARASTALRPALLLAALDALRASQIPLARRPDIRLPAP